MNVRLEIADHVARVTIDRPDKLNAVDAATEAELESVWRRLETGSMHASKRVWGVTRCGNADGFGRHRRRRSRHARLNARNILADNQRNLGSVRRHQHG